MKTLLWIAFFSLPFFAAAQSTGIGTTNPNSSALLDLTSNSKGILIPRMIKTERAAITTPADGLMVYQTAPDSIGFYYFHNTWHWLNDEASLPSTAIVMSSTQNNTNLLNNNFNYKGQLFLPGATIYNGSFLSTPNSWYSTSLNAGTVPPNGTVNFLSMYNSGSFYIWGGYSGTNTGVGLYKYDPVANSWNQLQGINNITARASGAFANGKWVIWGGLSGGADIAYPAFVYDFAGNTVSNAPASSDIARSAVTAVGIGNDVYFWGGYKYNDNNTAYNAGFKYSTVSNTWTSISSVNAPGVRYFAGGVSTGTKMIIWGGYLYNGGLPITYNTGGVYDIAGNSWTTMSNTNAPATGSGNPIMVWNGSNLIVISGNETKRYDVTGNTWTTLAAAPISFNGNKFAYDGVSKIYIWGGSTYYFPGSPTNAGYVYDITGNTYTALTTVNAPSARAGQVVTYGNNELFVWGGSASTGSSPSAAESLITGGRYILNSQTISSADSLGSIFLYEKK